MQVLNGIDFIPAFAKGAAVAIGNFDGVHRGHQTLIATAVGRARELGRPSGVIVFEPHPRQYFAPGQPHFHLTPLNEKLRVLAALGLKLVVVLPFDARMASLTAEAFIEDVLVSNLSVSHVVIGYDFFFGRKRGGNPQTMREAGARLGFGVSVVEPVAQDGEVFSSSEIRLKLARGDVAGAAQALGRNWRVSGRVIGGAKRGTGMGFPTANVPMPQGTALGHGIFAVHAIIDGLRHEAAAYLGTRPTFDDGMPVLEVFLFDFDGDLYGRDMTVEFIAFIRPDRKFADAGELVAQMEKDVAEARRLLAGP
ncbi:MAG: bifunctional riboflavin kinase/FMN adenylyltransferase [Hyphomicrobium sp.]|nr:MAG: bifunctional riboflavin kinase/FMN adenylyltransferase [Hyphomicrobium sp.]